MKHYLVDTNVVIDMILDREDADAACAVFDGAERGDFSAVADPQISAIITRNTKDFKESSLEVVDSISFLQK